MGYAGKVHAKAPPATWFLSTPAAAAAFVAGTAPFALALAARLQLCGLLLALVAQLEVIAPALGVDVAAGQCGLHGATGLRLVAAVGKAATQGQRLDVGEQVQ